MMEEAGRFLDDYSYQHPHDTKFMDRMKKELEEANRKDETGTSGEIAFGLDQVKKEI